MNFFRRIALLLLFSMILVVSCAWARLQGEVDWGYANYQESSDNAEDIKGAHFTQRYSLLYSQQGLFNGGRFGSYDFAAGAEWAAFDSDLEGEQYSADAFKLLYSGNLQIAPGALPFRLNAYSHDLAKISFGATSSYGILNPQIVTGLYNGQTIISGVQFMAGIRNGSYLGQYRDILSQWPRILIDYRDVYRRDLKARVPQEYRDSNLAFVSLNKKDNWFHYRINTHTDYQDPRQDSRETSIMLGTIDHKLQRQWIDLTNWIRISVDGAYTVSSMQWDPIDTKRYDLNHFTTLQRNGFSAYNLLSLQRVRRGSYLEQTLDLPVYTNYRLNPETNLRSKFEVWRNKEINAMRSGETTAEAYYGMTQMTTNQRGLMVYTPSLELELATGTAVGDGQAIRGRIEARTNPLRRKNPSFFAMGSLATFTGTGENFGDTSLWESELKAGTDYRLGYNMRMGAVQSLLYGTGKYGSQLTHFMHSASADGFGRYSGSDSQDVDGSLLRSETDLYFEHISAARVQNRFELKYKFQQGDVEQLYQLELRHKLDYRSRLWRFNLKNLYATGDDNSDYTPSGGLLDDVSNASGEWRFEHRGVAEFRPNNYWRARLEESLSLSEDLTGQQTQLFTLRQELERSFFTFGGKRRQKGEITQSLEYQQSQGNVDTRAMVFSLIGNYYPTSNWRLGASAHYYYRDYASNSLYWSLTTGLDFPKFRVDFSYQYGLNEESNAVAHRYEVNVKKTF